VEPRRESIAGFLDLLDWMVPALYQKGYNYIPFPKGEMPEPPDGVVAHEALLKRTEVTCPQGRHGFVGRDNDILRIERELRDAERPWVLVTGMRGIGKTEFVHGFARWYAETGGCPGGLYATSFCETASFGQVIGSIVGDGSEFFILSDEDQWNSLLSFLTDSRCLLVWDDFESVAGYPDGEQPLASRRERERLSRFLHALQGGRTRVIITTRKPEEEWLGIPYKQVELAGLTERDVAQLAKPILEATGCSPQDFRNDRNYTKLISLLRGHPRSLETVLPHLRSVTPQEIIDALHDWNTSLGEMLEDASLARTFDRMSSRTRKHLPVVGVFASYVSATTLSRLVAWMEEAHGGSYRALMGESIDTAGWEAVLEEASQVGLLRARGGPRYELHPTLPSFLRRRLAAVVKTEGVKQLDEAFLEFFAAWTAVRLEKEARRADANAMATIEFEEANLVRALRLAKKVNDWAAAQSIAQALCEFYEIRERLHEWKDLRADLLCWVGRELAPDADRSRGSLWMFLMGGEANDALDRNDLEASEAVNRQIQSYLVSMGDPEDNRKIALVYNNLGNVAFERDHLDEAETHYYMATEIFERLEDEVNAAKAYHGLGTVAQRRDEYDVARDWYHKALKIFQERRDDRLAATVCHQLSMVAQEEGRLDEAEAWCNEALDFYLRLHLDREAATIYDRLGWVAQQRGNLQVAESWWKKALVIYARLEDKAHIADQYQHLGVLCQMRGQLVRAEAWYCKALSTLDEMGKAREMLTVLGLKGTLNWGEQRRVDEGVASFGRGVALALEKNLAPPKLHLVGLADILNAVGKEKFEAAWKRSLKGDPPFRVLRPICMQLKEAASPSEALRRIMED